MTCVRHLTKSPSHAYDSISPAVYSRTITLQDKPALCFSAHWDFHPCERDSKEDGVVSESCLERLRRILQSQAMPRPPCCCGLRQALKGSGNKKCQDSISTMVGQEATASFKGQKPKALVRSWARKKGKSLLQRRNFQTLDSQQKHKWTDFTEKGSRHLKKMSDD